MMRTSHVIAAARWLRVVVMMLVAGLLVGFLAVQSFVSQYGSSATVVTMDVRNDDAALTAAISVQESGGLHCTTKPTPTDVVLFQRLGESQVSVISFDDAIAESAAHEGWIRSYCA